ncbi:non-ribosomal peptide synthetase [Photorhabdus sp. SF281]|uniref:non-ribosomal peptide synthetase n=1 Tax=Photorhabdus sp. SF281 TaxID=3459527 RepID=UPI004044198A
MYTSGSTGKPKGVMIPYAQLHNWIEASWERIPFSESEVMLQKTPIIFAVSVKELLSGLLQGIPLVLANDVLTKDIKSLSKIINYWSVTRLYLVPSHLESLLDYALIERFLLQSLRYVITAGEPLLQSLKDRTMTQLPQVSIWNNYGCTELNDVTYCEPYDFRTGSRFVPIGFPIWNTEVYVLDEQLRQVPIGVIGELHVCSVGMALGYLGQPKLTAQKFIANPYSNMLGARLYKTGDLVRYLSDGSLEFMGRDDFEIKVRGHRIDIRQVESIANNYECVKQAVIVAWPPSLNPTKLVAFLSLNKNSIDITDFSLYMSKHLPSYMVPSLYKILDNFPTLPNGKLDRSSLQAFDVNTMRYKKNISVHSNIEMQLEKIFGQILHLNNIELSDSFFELGGNSLLVMHLVSKIQSVFNVTLQINKIFESPTILELSELIFRLQQSNQEKNFIDINGLFF